MRAVWEDYDGAIERLKKDSRDKLTREQVTNEIMQTSTGVFAREVRNNPLFLLHYKSDPTGKATYYNRLDLIGHFERMRDKVEPAELIWDYYNLQKDADFYAKHGKHRSDVFPEGCYLSITISE